MGSTTPHYEYKVAFPELRNTDSTQLQFAEMELPGLLLDDGQYVPLAEEASFTSYWLIRGSTDGNNPVAEDTALENEKHEVRCCADSRLPGFKANSICTLQLGREVWGESKFGDECYHSKTHAGAMDICESVGARLCTKEEIQADCTRGTGCNHNHDLVWTSTPVIVAQTLRVQLRGNDTI